MTESIYLEVSENTEAAQKAGRWVSVSEMLKFLGVSRSRYLAWLHHVPSDTEKRRKAVKAKIQDIYDDSKQNYGAPKITVELRDSDFSTELQNILDEQFNPDRPNAVWCSNITYIWTIDGFVYLTSVMDLFSRKIIAWTLSIRIVAANMLQRNIKKQPKICSAVIRRKLFRGIMHALNPFILLSNVNGSIALKFATISRHTS